MKQKSSKQKCLEMWEWLAENPEKSKNDYRNYLHDKNKLDEYETCWACVEAAFECSNCPITFPEGSCLKDSSCYQIWDREDDKKYPNRKNSREAALEMVELIKTTWIE